jgi:hypothetical protein
MTTSLRGCYFIPEDIMVLDIQLYWSLAYKGELPIPSSLQALLESHDIWFPSFLRGKTCSVHSYKKASQASIHQETINSRLSSKHL